MAVKRMTHYLWVGYIAAVLWLLFCNSHHGGNITVCPTKLLWHIPCPGCGITRATLLFMEGNFLDAIKMNPNVLFSVLFITTFPIMAITQRITGIDYVHKIYVLVENCLRQKPVLFVVLCFEIMVEVNNITNHI